MPVTWQSLLLRNQRDVDRRLVEDHLRLAREISARMIAHANADGTLPDASAVRRQIQGDVWREVLKPYYVGPTEAALQGADPNSPYARVVIQGIERATRIQVERQARLVRQAVGDPVVAQWLTGPRPAALQLQPQAQAAATPSDRFAGLRNADGRIDMGRARADLVRPRGFYDPHHKWVDPNGYQLSDRIWNVADDTRQRIDRLMDYHISRGTSAVEIARELEQFLTPSARGQKTVRPYGTEGSYAARRLARTEITVAAHRATVNAARVNPMVMGIQWRLSASHPKRDICDDYAQGGPKGDGIYPPESVPAVPHPHCLCSQLPVPVGDRDDVVAILQDSIQDARGKLFAAVDPAAAVQLQGILNPEFLTNAIINGTLDESVREAVTRVQLGITPRPTVVPVVDPVRRRPTLPATTPGLEGDEVVFRKADTPPAGARLNGIPFDTDPPPDWRTVADNPNFIEPAFDDKGKKTSAGILMVEPDGRIWLVEPTNHFGGYQHTFPKGGIEPGHTLQQTALKEVWEESGLRAEITGFLTDAEGGTTTTRYYIGRRVGGSPWAMGWESQAVKLVTPERAAALLNVKRDKDTLAALRAMLPTLGQAAPIPVPVAAPVVAPAPVVVETVTARVAQAVAGLLDDGFPDNLDRLETVRTLGGSTGARLVRDPVDGRQYVLKRGNDAGHLREEVAADRAYQALGVNVPPLHLYETAQGPVKLTEFIEGKTLKELRTSSPAAYQKALKAVQKDFAADAVLGNWDVIGMDFDNILVGKGGKVWRIDNGGALRRRAQGQMKSTIAPWNQYVDELWSLRNPRVNRQTAEVFGSLDYGEITTQLRRVSRKQQAVLDALPDDLRPLMEGRFEIAKDLVKISDTFRKDQWQTAYIDDFSRDSIALRKAGLIDRLPQKLAPKGRKQGKSAVYMYDENGKPWDDLRGNGSIVERLSEFMQNNGANYGIIQEWASEQAGDSWYAGPQALKYYLYRQRTMTEGDFWWKAGIDVARHHHDQAMRQYGEEKYRRTFTMWHAFNYEFVRNVDFTNNNRRRGLIKLMRTEKLDVMQMNNLRKGQTGPMRRGMAESTSIVNPVYVHGTELTLQQVPHHRVLGNYFLERGPGANSALFLSDRENELVVMLDGLDVKYEGSRYK